MLRQFIPAASLAIAVALFTGLTQTETAGSSGLGDIKGIMKRAHLTPGNRGTRDNLDNKVLDGKATDAEKKELLSLYTALSKATPPTGEIEAWKQRTSELVDALKAVYRGDEKSAARFIRARDCKSCHALHRKVT